LVRAYRTPGREASPSFEDVEQPRHLVPDRAHAQIEPFGDLVVGAALAQLLSDDVLPRGQRDLAVPRLARPYCALPHSSQVTACAFTASDPVISIKLRRPSTTGPSTSTRSPSNSFTWIGPQAM
jgi:hypothetical protein